MLLFLDFSYQSNHLTAQKMKLPNPQITADLVTFTEEIIESSLFHSQFSLISFVFVRLQIFQTALTLKRNMHITWKPVSLHNSRKLIDMQENLPLKPILR